MPVANPEVTYSYSRLTKYETCPRAYKYKYVDREKGSFDSIEGFLGSRVHEAVQHIYQQRALGREASLEDILMHYELNWFGAWQTSRVPIRVVKKGKETEEDYFKLGQETLLKCFSRLKNDRRPTVGTEVKIEGQLADGNFVGYIDRVAGEYPHFTLIDYKTSKHCPEEFIGKEADQLRTYAYFLLKKHKLMEAVSLELDFVRHNKTLTGVVTHKDMPKIEQMLLSKISAASGPHYPTRVSILCDWCEFNDRCPGPKKKGAANAPPF